jgi:hypothetical protein
MVAWLGRAERAERAELAAKVAAGTAKVAASRSGSGMIAGPVLLKLANSTPSSGDCWTRQLRTCRLLRAWRTIWTAVAAVAAEMVFSVQRQRMVAIPARIAREIRVDRTMRVIVQLSIFLLLWDAFLVGMLA